MGNGAKNGTPGNDLIFGDEFENTLVGENGDDVLVARAGDDKLRGSAGDDTLFGEEGDDDLNGAAGIDWLIGGIGDDIHVGAGDADRFGFNFNGEAGASYKTAQFADGTRQSAFSQQYHDFLDQLEQYGQDLDGDGQIVYWNQNTGAIRIERTTVDVTLGGFDTVKLHNGQARSYYTEVSVGGSIKSEDGHDTINDFEWGVDKLSFGGVELTQAQFESSFKLLVGDFNDDGVADTKLSLNDDTWSVTLLGVSGKNEAAFFNEAVSLEDVPVAPIA